MLLPALDSWLIGWHRSSRLTHDNTSRAAGHLSKAGAQYLVREYDLIADWYASERGETTGVPETVSLASAIPSRSLVLDIGCGNGVPITRALVAAGHQVVGIDSSPAMLAGFRRNVPEALAIRATVERCPFRDSIFDGAVAWGVLFHLLQPDQIAAIASVSRVLAAGALFLFTAGDVDGSTARLGAMNGVEFKYYSFTVDAYRRILADHGLALIDSHEDHGKNRYYLARKSAWPRAR